MGLIKGRYLNQRSLLPIKKKYPYVSANELQMNLDIAMAIIKKKSSGNDYLKNKLILIFIKQYDNINNIPINYDIDYFN